jgi:hypothetical protein
MGCVLIVLQSAYHVSPLASFNGEGLFWTFIEILVGASIMALPALSIFYLRQFRFWVAVTTPIYPIFMAVGFWIANTLGHPLAYGIWFLYVLLPLAAAYGVILYIDGRILKSRVLSSQTDSNTTN